MTALEAVPHDRARFRTTALPAGGTVIGRLDTIYGPVINDLHPDHVWTQIWTMIGHYAVLGTDPSHNLVQKAWFDTWSNRVTSSPHVLVAEHQSASVVQYEPNPAAPCTAAQRAVAELRALSGLTNEEIAPLAGVSRRGLQAWIAGTAISARKEQRLRALVEAVHALAGRDGTATRMRLLDRVPGCVRPYDLMAEGRFEAAVDLALGRRSGLSPVESRPVYDLAAQLDHLEDRVDVPEGRLNRRLSGRLRR